MITLLDHGASGSRRHLTLALSLTAALFAASCSDSNLPTTPTTFGTAGSSSSSPTNVSINALSDNIVAQPVGSYVRNNFWITTSGYLDDHPFQLARNVIGDSRLMFSVDYPFSDNATATRWLHGLGLGPDALHGIAHRCHYLTHW